MLLSHIQLYTWDEAQERLQELREVVARRPGTDHHTLLLQRWEPFDLNGRWVRGEYGVN